MSEQQAAEPKTIAAATDAENWSQAWKLAEAKAQAHLEKGGGKVEHEEEEKPAPKPKAKSTKEDKQAKLDAKEPKAKAKSEEAKEEEPEAEEEEKPSKPEPKKAAKKAEEPEESDEGEEKPAKAAKPEKDEEPEADADEEDEESDEEEKKPAKKEPADDLAKLEKLAKKLGMKLENGAVTVEERAGFRAEKRKWRERRDAEEADFNNRIASANKRFNPFLAAERAVNEGDFDAALVALGLKGGLTEANEKFIEQASGKDPRVSKLEQELARERAERVERERQAQEAQRASEQERADRDALAEIGSELAEHNVYGPLAKNEWFLQGVLKVIKDNWDGYETLTSEQAAAEHLQLLRKNVRAKMAYDAMRLVFEASSPRDRGAKTREPSSDDDEDVDRSNETSARPGKKPTKSLPRRKAAEAGARREFKNEQEWSRWAAGLMSGASDS